MLLHKPPGGC